MTGRKTPDKRKSRRFEFRMAVEVHGRTGTRTLASTDVSRHGIFIATSDPPLERHVVRLTLHAPTGKVNATAWVSRSISDAVDASERGAGLQFFSMTSESKQRWDEFFFSRQADEPARVLANDARVDASFMLKLSVETLREFERSSVGGGGTFMVTPVLRPPGARIALHLVHPDSEEEFVLLGTVARVHTGRPKGLEIKFLPLSAKASRALHTFIATGAQVDDEVTVTPLEAMHDTPAAVSVEALSLSMSDFSEEALTDFDLEIDIVEPAAHESFTWAEADQKRMVDLDIDDDLLIDFDDEGTLTEVSISAQDRPLLDSEDDFEETERVPTGPPHSAEELLRRLDPPVCLGISCSGCELRQTVTIGRAAGLLGLVADRVPLWNPATGQIDVADRLGPTADRRARLQEASGGGLDGLSVPVAVLLAAASLAEPPTSARGDKLTATAAMRELVRAAPRLESGAHEVALEARCPACQTGTWTVFVPEGS